jgi:hypothetical protein
MAGAEIPFAFRGISRACEAEKFPFITPELPHLLVRPIWIGPPLIRSRGWPAVHRCTTSCRFEASEPIPFPGADSIFSSRCGAFSGRLRLPSASRGARPAIEMPRFSPRAGFGGIGRRSGAARRSSSAESEIPSAFRGISRACEAENFPSASPRRDSTRSSGAAATESPFVSRSKIQSRRSAVLRRGAMRAAASTAGADASWGRWLLERLAMTEIQGAEGRLKVLTRTRILRKKNSEITQY